jgi:Trpc4-associated protein
MLKVLIRAQITGKGCKSLRQVPTAVYGRLQSRTPEIAPLCIELESAVVGYDVDSCQEVLSKVAQSLCEWNNDDYQLNREAFVLFGGDTLLLRALFCKFPAPDNSEKLRFTVKVLYIRNECLSILRELCSTVHPFIEHLAADKKFVVKLFGMMRFHNTFNNGECAHCL